MVPLKLELFSTPHCAHCDAAAERIRDRLGTAEFELERQNVLDDIDRAVGLGIRQMPALVINAQLVHQGPITEKHLQRLFTQQPWRR